MADDGLERFEAILGAISKVTSGDGSGDMYDARCPNCRASNFVSVSDLWMEAVGRISESPESAQVARVAGLSDADIVQRFAPPQRRSALIVPLAVAIPLGVVAFFVYRRFGEDPGSFAAIGAAVITIGVLLTTLRKRSDEYYAERRQWRHLFLCRDCGQVVRS